MSQPEDTKAIVKVDKREQPNVRNVKNLARARDLPVECNVCKYRSKEEGGNGICPKYQKDSLCTVRPDIRKIVAKYGIRNTGQVLSQIEEEFDANYEKLKLFEYMENRAGALDPEVTKRIAVMNNLAKTIAEIKLKKTTVELREKTILTDQEKTEIAKLIRLTEEKHE